MKNIDQRLPRSMTERKPIKERPKLSMLLSTVGILLALVAGTSASRGQAVFALIGEQNGRLDRLDITAGTHTLIRANSGVYYGLAFNADQTILYGIVSSSVGSLSQLVKIDTATGVNTLVGDTGQALSTFTSLADGRLFSVGYDANLYQLNPNTGAATMIGATGRPFSGTFQNSLASDGTILYYTLTFGGNSSLYVLSLTTGAATSVGPTASGIIGSVFAGPTFGTGQLYAFRNNGETDIINLSTGAATRLNSNGITDIFGGVGIITTVVVPPSIVALTLQPPSPVIEGTNVNFTVVASGTAPLSYRWSVDGTRLIGATNASLTLTNVSADQSGVYGVVVSNTAGTAVASTGLVVLASWHTNNVGGTGAGSSSQDAGVFTVNGSGEDIEGTEDAFFFVHRTLSGDGQIIARLLDLVPADPHSEAGVMFRDGTNSGARHVFLGLDAGNKSVFRRRLVENDYSVENFGPRGMKPTWLRLMRLGDTFVGHQSTNGVDWSLVWWTTLLNMPTNLDVGLAVTAHKNGAMATATFDKVVTGELTPLSGTWPEAGPRLLLGGELGGMAEFQRLGGLKLLVGGVVGDRFSILVSPAVTLPTASWVPVGTVTNRWGVVQFLDPQALTNGIRFYSAQRVEP